MMEERKLWSRKTPKMEISPVFTFDEENLNRADKRKYITRLYAVSHIRKNRSYSLMELQKHKTDYI